MRCRRARKSLLDHEKGNLAKDELEEIREHLSTCEECAALAGKLELSGKALSSIQPEELSSAASSRVLEAVREAGRKEKFQPVGLLRSPRALALGAGAAAVLVAVAVVVGLNMGDGTKRREGPTTVANKGVEQSVPPVSPSAPLGYTGETEDTEGARMTVGPAPEPLVKVTANDYTPESLRSTFDSLGVKKEFAGRYTLADAINLGPTFTKRAADKFADLGQDAPLLEAIISYIKTTEPVLLPCYVEKARFQGQDVWILGLSGPPRSGKSTRLTRIEVWVMNPQKFEQNPDSGIVFFLEQK